MLKILLHILREIWAQRIALFWPIWTVITIAAAMLAARIAGKARPLPTGIGNGVAVAVPGRRGWLGAGAIAALALMLLFLAGYTILIFKWEAFDNYDHSRFTSFTLQGRPWPIDIWREDGRFFPLGGQEFNVLRYFTHSVAGYHALCVVELIAFCGVLLVLDDGLAIEGRVALAVLTLMVTTIFISFSGLIYEERNVLLLLVCFALAIKRFAQTHSPIAAVAVAVCVQIMLYYKETAFLLIGGFAVAHLALRWWGSDRPHPERLLDRTSILDYLLLCLGSVFLLYYGAVMFPHPTMRYATDRQFQFGHLFIAYAKLDLLAWVFVAFVLGRAYLLLRRRAEPEPLWDGLAFGGVACFAGYLLLRMVSSYYLAPVDLVAVLYLGRWAILSWRNLHPMIRAVTVALLTVIFLQNVSLSAFRLFEEKNVVHAKAEIARVVETHNSSSAGPPLRLFFPFSRPYTVMEFASYLSYEGIPVERVSDNPVGPRGVVLVSKAIAKDGPCVDYRSILCHAGEEPEQGDFVIVMPDDDASRADVTRYRDEGLRLLVYEPYPSIPRVLNPFIARLHFESPIFSTKSLPDRWLEASVTTWK